MLKHQRNMKKIKKECMKNMIAGPCLVEAGLKVHKQSHSYGQAQNKDGPFGSSGFGSKSHKNSQCGPAYNSDTEDNKNQDTNRVRDEVNREAKHWHHQFHRMSSHDDLNDL